MTLARTGEVHIAESAPSDHSAMAIAASLSRETIARSIMHDLSVAAEPICQCGELAGRNIAVEIHIRLFGKAVTGDMRQHLVAQRAGRDVMPQDEHVGAADLFAHESVAQIAFQWRLLPCHAASTPS